MDRWNETNFSSHLMCFFYYGIVRSTLYSSSVKDIVLFNKMIKTENISVKKDNTHSSRQVVAAASLGSQPVNAYLTNCY